jgi:hypothetical protein
VKTSDNGQKSTQLTLVKMTVTTVQRSTSQNDGDNNMSDKARASGLNNGKQSTDLGKLDAVDVEQCRDTEKTGRQNKP